jgi:hypothetical protein
MAAAAPAAIPRPRPVGSRNWRRCAQHPQTTSEHVCPACKQGHCRECVQLVRNAAICPTCEGLCVSASSHAEKEQQEFRRRRPMMDETMEIFTYPLTDTVAFLMMVFVVWIFTVARSFAGFSMGGGTALLLSKGLLAAYSFNALVRASNGHFRGFMPDISGLGDLAGALWAGTVAWLASSWPLILAAVLGWNNLMANWAYWTQPRQQSSIVIESVVHAQDAPSAGAAGTEATHDDEEEDPNRTPAPWDKTPATPEPGAHREKGFVQDVEDQIHGRHDPVPPPPALGALFWALIVFGVVWNIVYMPVALIVAAITRTAGAFSSLVQTMNPLVGIGAILRMGPTYWQVLGLYLAIVIPQAILSAAAGYVPFVGGLIGAFIDGYASLAVGFALGLGVFKKGEELGLH